MFFIRSQEYFFWLHKLLDYLLWFSYQLVEQLKFEVGSPGELNINLCFERCGFPHV